MAQHTIFLDIETIPSQLPEYLAKCRAAVTPPGNIKKPESIAAWLEEHGEAAAREAVAKTSLDPAAGHVCAIGWARDHEPTHIRVTGTVEGERSIIADFFNDLGAFDRCTFVGHYISGFDLRFLLCRAVVLGIQIPYCIPRDPKPWDDRVFDTMTAWAGARGTISLDKLCDAMGIPGKDGFDGSMVAEAWANREYGRIADYCEADVERVRRVWFKFKAAGWIND